jgi:hypothetical protein
MRQVLSHVHMVLSTLLTSGFFDLFIVVLSSAVEEVNYKRKCQLLVFALIQTLWHKILA